jgi:hypothetical protein
MRSEGNPKGTTGLGAARPVHAVGKWPLKVSEPPSGEYEAGWWARSGEERDLHSGLLSARKQRRVFAPTYKLSLWIFDSSVT